VCDRSLTLRDRLSGNQCLMTHNGCAFELGLFDAVELIPWGFLDTEVMAENIDHIMMASSCYQCNANLNTFV
jgi:hypothetical protein